MGGFEVTRARARARLREAAWREELHPRDPLGRFRSEVPGDFGYIMDVRNLEGMWGMRKALKKRGHSARAIAAADDILDTWRGDDERAKPLIAKALKGNTPTGRVLRDRIRLETAAAKRRARKARGYDRYLYRETPEGEVSGQGVMESWTTNPEGAHSVEITGPSPWFKPDTRMRLSDLLKRYDVLAGFHVSPGYPGEDEVILIDKRAVRHPEKLRIRKSGERHYIWTTEFDYEVRIAEGLPAGSP